MKNRLLIALAGAALFGASGVVLAQSSTKSIWDGAYTTAQATRGKTAYANNCSAALAHRWKAMTRSRRWSAPI
jgi:hypothetical protein